MHRFMNLMGETPQFRRRCKILSAGLDSLVADILKLKELFLNDAEQEIPDD